MALFDKLFRRNPAIVAIGGGTGASSLLRGLKDHTDKLTAIVNVADDGGSSGRFRKEFGVLPPGDVRNCLAALSAAGPVLEQLLQYRFEDGELKGHAFGNIFLAALTKVTGNFADAVKEANRVLSVRGQVLPATNVKVSLVAEHQDGTKTTGESLVGRGEKPISRLHLKPGDAPAGPDVVAAVMQADLIVLGPGSLYTSVLPNLLIGELREALLKTPALVGYVCNIMTQAGETAGMSASAHARAVIEHTSPALLDFVLVNTGEVPAKLAQAYQAEGARRVEADSAELARLPGAPKIVAADLVNTENLVRHHPAKLADVLMASLREMARSRSA